MWICVTDIFVLTVEFTPSLPECKSQEKRLKQMMLGLFDNECLHCTNIVLREATDNADYEISTLKQFLKRMYQKSPVKPVDSTPTLVGRGMLNCHCKISSDIDLRVFIQKLT